MDDPIPFPFVERSEVTRKRHRSETFWQVIAPIIVVALLALSLAILAALAPVNRVRPWADISLIWLILPVFVVLLITMAFLGVAIYAVIQLTRVLPFYFQRLQGWFALLARRTGRVCDQAARPVVGLKASAASLRQLRRSIRRK